MFSWCLVGHYRTPTHPLSSACVPGDTATSALLIHKFEERMSTWVIYAMLSIITIATQLPDPLLMAPITSSTVHLKFPVAENASQCHHYAFLVLQSLLNAGRVAVTFQLGQIHDDVDPFETAEYLLDGFSGLPSSQEM